MKDKVNVGIIGAGIMGTAHARIYTEMDRASLLGIADINIEKARSLAAKYGVKKTFKDYRDLLKMEDLDAIHIATPDFFHRDPILDALKAGKHVLVEKPLATTVEDAKEIVKVSKDTGKHVMVNYTHRWAAPYAATKNYISEGQIGSAVMVYARKDDTLWAATEMMNWTAKTSSASYLSTHDIDLVVWWLESDIEHVYALGVKKVLKERNIDTEDAIQALVRFKNGAIGTFESCWVLPNTMPTNTDSFIEIIGEKGTIHIDRIHEGLKVATAEKYFFPKLSLNCDIQGRHRGGVQMCLEHFIETLRRGERPQPDAEHGLKIVKVSLAIQLSIARKETVYIDSL
ncbi:MAG TPA: Gfo/Idh/MocA family oxidoreductase [Spirochaetia bacterium]|nr:Gfo/Idh/MocA family oxidoreductase [Spirochaetia bacterium]